MGPGGPAGLLRLFPRATGRTDLEGMMKKTYERPVLLKRQALGKIAASTSKVVEM
jgi:hypothetical protein